MCQANYWEKSNGGENDIFKDQGEVELETVLSTFRTNLITFLIQIDLNKSHKLHGATKN